MFLYVLGEKGLKTDKNKSSLHNWQFQSMNFEKLSKLVPGYSKHGKLSLKVLRDSQVVKISPLKFKFVKWQLGSLKFQKWQNKSPEFSKIENYLLWSLYY